MYVRIEINSENPSDLRKIAEAIAILGDGHKALSTETAVTVSDTPQKTETIPVPTEIIPDPIQMEPKPKKAKKTSSQNQEEIYPTHTDVPIQPATTDSQEPETTDAQEPLGKDSTEPTDAPNVDIAMCRALATKGIQANKQNEVNAIVRASGAARISEIPQDKLFEVYSKLKALVGE